MAMPTMVRNTAAGPTVFSDGGHNVEWQGAGDEMGGDLQPVPTSFTENVQFHRMVARGIFEIESADDVIQAALTQHKREWQSRLAAQRAASKASIDTAPQDDSVVKGCIGPSGRGVNEKCGVDVPVKVAKLAEVPPLCPLHSGLAGQFIAQPTDKIIEGKPEITWAKAQLGAPTRQD